MTDYVRQHQAQSISDVVMHHTREVNQLIGLYKQQAASLDQLTDMMARLTRILETVSHELSKESGIVPAPRHTHAKNPLPFFMGRQSGIMRGSSEA